MSLLSTIPDTKEILAVPPRCVEVPSHGGGVRVGESSASESLNQVCMSLPVIATATERRKVEKQIHAEQHVFLLEF